MLEFAPVVVELHFLAWDGTGDSAPLTWDYGKRLRRKMPYEKDIAVTTCLKGHTLRVSSDVHRIADDGTMNPSYVCPVDGCGFHEWVRLVGWKPGHVYEYADGYGREMRCPQCLGRVRERTDAYTEDVTWYEHLDEEHRPFMSPCTFAPARDGAARVVCTKDPLEDIGYGVTIERRYMDGVLRGVAVYHPRPDGSGPCPGYGWVAFTPEWPDGWELVSERPLTLSPSLLCRNCGHHGHIVDGRWVPA